MEWVMLFLWYYTTGRSRLVPLLFVIIFVAGHLEQGVPLCFCTAGCGAAVAACVL